MTFTQQDLALLGLSAIVGALVASVVFALQKFSAAARSARVSRSAGAETALLASALEEAVNKLKAQERATAARAEATERLSGEILVSLTAGLLVAGLDGEVRILNPAARRMLRVPDSTALDDYRGLLRGPELSAVIDECFSTKQPIVRRMIALPEASDGVLHLGVTVSPLFGDRGEMNGAICLFTDLTTVTQLEEQLRMKEGLATVGELTAGIAHEFRNGLATIHGYGRLIDLAALPETYRPYVEGIRAETESLGQVVTNFLQFARPAQLILSRVDLRLVCDRAAEELRAEVLGLGGDITVRGEFPALEGDEVLLRQAFSNLIRNAVEACVGGSVAPVIVIQGDVDRAQHVFRIVVDDNGPGIDPTTRERVFRPFFTSKRNGTGLGLALVQKIIVFHNGRISVGASAMGGASLQIFLPLDASIGASPTVSPMAASATSTPAATGDR